jgi:hypothetical protein
VNGLAFASSLITSALWPIVVVVAVLVFREPLAGLIGRTKRYEGLGQKLEFGPALAEAEDSVSMAVQDAPTAEKQAEIEPSPLVREAETNPSYVVLQAWEQLSAAIADLAGVAFPDQRTASWRSARSLPELQKRELVSREFANAVVDLRDLRNQVAHGQSKPTPGEAVAYAESAQVLALLARNAAHMLANQPLATAE